MKILMVCLGNICRSPLAEGIMLEKIKKNNLDAIVDSAGTAAYHTGEKPDLRSMDVARKHGIDISYQRARQFITSDFDNFNMILVMDEENYRNVTSLARNQDDIAKVSMILNHLPERKNIPVPDPYYGGKDGFENVFKMLDQACEAIAKKLAGRF